MKSEMKMPRDRDREVKCQQNSRETRLSQVTETNYQTFYEFKKYQVSQQGDNCFGNTSDQREVNSKIKINHCFMEVSKKTIYY